MIEDLKPFTCRNLPEELTPLFDLALDVRWTWNHSSDHLWKTVDPSTWERTRNPWWMLQSISRERFEELVDDLEFRNELDALVKSRLSYVAQPGLYRQDYPATTLTKVAYFSMEFGLSEAIPLYAGGLGMLAGDYLKTASDLNFPLVGVGLFYQHGYFRQILAHDGTQTSANPPNDPISLPMQPATDARGGWLRVALELPGRQLLLRVWKVQVGRSMLYLLDSNDPANEPSDRSIVNKLYDDPPQYRLLQEMVLGIGGWRVLEALGIHPEVCHFNEGHAAFVVLERARSFMRRSGQTFPVSLWATRAGNVFTTHTAVPASFDLFPRALVQRYLGDYAPSLGISLDQLLGLGSQNPADPNEPFNMAVLAMRGCTRANGVSQLHGEVSRRIFQTLFPGWPQHEVPVSHITNGVHMPSWDSQEADHLWTGMAGKGCWCVDTDDLTSAMQQPSDKELWSLRDAGRQELVSHVRRRIKHQSLHNPADSRNAIDVSRVLDPNALTLGFARRFASYKRPNLLLQDRERLIRILNRPGRPVQLVIAGKAHPMDEEGKRLVQEMVRFSQSPEAANRVVFLPDYDIELAQELVQGIDLWVNTPRRPWEACGTSGMKVLVNGGLNLSELDGWWAEAYQPEFGWSIGDGYEHDPAWDAVEAGQLYRLLDDEIIPEFYERNEEGVPLKWVRRIRASMCCLAPRFSSNRMLRDYIESVYHPAAGRLEQRLARSAGLARELYSWQQSLQNSWAAIRLGKGSAVRQDSQWQIECDVYLGDLDPQSVAVEIYADPFDNGDYVRQAMLAIARLPDPEAGYRYHGSAPATRPIEHYSIRIVPAHAAAVIPLEDNHILWKHPIPG